MKPGFLYPIFLLSLAAGLHGQERDPRLIDPELNLAENLHGVQIGVLNYAGNQPQGLRWLPIVNARF